MNFDNQLELQDLLDQLGEFGPYQFKQHCLHGLSWALGAIHMMSFVFVFPVVQHICNIAEIDVFNQANRNTTNELQMYIPRNAQGKFESCVKYENLNGTIVPCENGYIYNYSSVFTSSRVSDWDMVCEKSWMRALLQSIFLSGTLVGSLICGYLADKFGRKAVYCFSGVAQCVCGVVGVFLDNYAAFAFSMFWYGLFGSSACLVPAIALTMELVGPSKRSICGTSFTVWFDFGCIIVATFALLTHANAKRLQLIYALHSVLLFGHYWFMDESISWLWINGNQEKAVQIAKKAIKFNGKEFKTNCHKESHDIPNPIKLPKNDATNVGFLDLFRHPKLRQRTMVMLCCWLSCALSYYGLSFNSVNLVGNPHLMFIINILVEIPGHRISIFLVSKTGNKLMFCFSLLITGGACVTVPLLSPTGILSICVTMMAKVTATVTFNVINSYTAELFPTSLRNTAMGICMMASRSGATIIPLINLFGRNFSGEQVPMITFGIIGIVAGILSFSFLPETMNKPIPQTINDVEKS